MLYDLPGKLLLPECWLGRAQGWDSGNLHLLLPVLSHSYIYKKMTSNHPKVCFHDNRNNISWHLAPSLTVGGREQE